MDSPDSPSTDVEKTAEVAAAKRRAEQERKASDRLARAAFALRWLYGLDRKATKPPAS
jgi:hypothetical protein